MPSSGARRNRGDRVTSRRTDGPVRAAAPSTARDLPLERLQSPAWRAELLSRPRLVRRLAGHVDARRLSALCAPAGYGKTTLLADFVRQSGRLCVWLRLDESDRDPSALLAALATAVEVARPPTAAPPAAGGSDADRLGDESVIYVANAIAGRQSHTVVVLDDLHSIAGSPAAVRTIRQLVRLTPEHVRFVTSGRHAMPRSLGELAGPGGLVPLDARALRFTRDEIEALLERNEVPVDEWPALRADTAACEGWPAAVSIALMAWRIGEGRGPAVERRAAGPAEEDVFGSIAAAFLDGLDEADSRLLHEAAHLERITPELCRTCLGVPDAAERLERIAGTNLFLDHRRGDDAYRMHALLRRHLTEASPRRRPFTSDQHRCAARYYRRGADVVEEIRHLAAAGDVDATAGRLRDVAPELTRTARWHTLADLLGRYERASGGELPAELARYMARAQLAIGDTGAAVATVDRALAGASLGEDELVSVYITSSFARRSQGALADALRDAETALEHAEALGPAPKVKALRVIGQIHAAELRLDRAGECFAEAYELASAAETGGAAALAALDLSAFELVRGRLDAARRHAEVAAALAGDRGYVDALLIARNNQALAWHFLGKYSQAMELFDDVLEEARKVGHHHIEALAWLGRGDLHADLQMADSAERGLRRGLALALELGEAELISHALRSLAGHHRAMGDLAESRRLLAEPGAPGGADDLLSTVGHAVQEGALSSAEGNHAHAVERLLWAVATLDEAGALVASAQARLELAHAQFRARGVAAAVPTLERLGRTVAEVGGNQYLVPAAGRMPRMWGALGAAGRGDLHAALARPDQRPRVSPRQRGLPETARPDDPHPRLLTPRERELVIALCDGLSRDDIATRLGLSRSTIDKTISAIYASTGFRQAYQLVSWAYRCGLYGPATPPPGRSDQPR